MTFEPSPGPPMLEGNSPRSESSPTSLAPGGTSAAWYPSAGSTLSASNPKRREKDELTPNLRSPSNEGRRSRPWGRRASRRTLILVAVVFAISLGAGVVLGAITVVPNSETGNGAYITSNTPGYWRIGGNGNTPNPGAVVLLPSGLTAASTVMASPTVLPGSGTSYSVGAVTVGDWAQVIEIDEQTGPPASTELEIFFTLTTATASTFVTVFVETQAAPPGGTVVYDFYLDAGSPTGGSVTIVSAQEISNQCNAVNSCP